MVKNLKTHYFVDETGDATFFNSRGKPISFEKTNVSKFFMIGAVKIKNDLSRVINDFEFLRNDLINDPFIKNIPSIKKTATMFHAKDDCAVVRREVFNLLKKTNLSVYVAIRRKNVLLNEAKDFYKLTKKKTYINEKRLYNDLVSKLFENLLHKNHNRIIFSKRGKTFNNESLIEALQKAKLNFYRTHNIKHNNEINVKMSGSNEFIGLQIIDYHLWALQKMSEKGKAEYFDLLRNNFKFIMDLDDKRNKVYGEYYDKKNKITLDKIKGEF